MGGFWFFVFNGGWVQFIVVVTNGGLILGWGLWWW